LTKKKFVIIIAADIVCIDLQVKELTILALGDKMKSL